MTSLPVRELVSIAGSSSALNSTPFSAHCEMMRAFWFPSGVKRRVVTYIYRRGSVCPSLDAGISQRRGLPRGAQDRCYWAAQ